MVSLIVCFKPAELPLPLRIYQVVSFCPDNPEKGLNGLLAYVDASLA